MGEKVAKKFSPWGIVRKNEFTILGRQNISYELAGISVIDYLDLYKKSPATLIKRVINWIILLSGTWSEET